METRIAPPLIKEHAININEKHDQDHSVRSKSKSKSENEVNDAKLGLEVQQMIAELRKEIYDEAPNNKARKEHQKRGNFLPAMKSGKDRKKKKEVYDKSGINSKDDKSKKTFRKNKDSDGLKTGIKNSEKKPIEAASNLDLKNANEKVVILRHESCESLSSASYDINDESTFPNEPVIHPKKEINTSSNRKPSNQDNNEQKLGPQLPTPVVADEDQCILQENGILIMKNVNPKFPQARLFCKICDYHCDNMQVVNRHVTVDRHLELKYEWDIKRTIKHLPEPTKDHETALTNLLTNLFTDYNLTEDDLLARKHILNRIKGVLLPSLPDCELQMYGSSLTGFGLRSSDLNIHLHIPQKDDPASVLKKTLQILQDDDNASCKNVLSDFLSKIPGIHFIDAPTHLKCSININNSIAVETSQLLSLYHSLDPRAPVLSVAFALWAKTCHINQQSYGTLPSYSFTLMLINFLQQVKPPVLPIISVASPVKPVWKSENKMSIGLLWLRLFKYYSVTFKCLENVINIRQLETLTQSDKNWRGRRLAIEDPYSGKRNVARSVSHSSVFDHILNQFKKSYLYFGIPQTAEGPLFKTISIYINSSGSAKGLPHNSNTSKDPQSSKGAVLVDEINSKIKKLHLGDLIYTFDVTTLTSGKFPAIICRLCQHKGHIDDECPEEKLPAIIPLPPVTEEFLQVTSHICEDVMYLNALSNSDKVERAKILFDLKGFIQQTYEDARLQLFGSSCNGFGFRTSDLDICLTFHGNDTGEGLDFPSIVETLAERLKKRKDLKDVTAVSTAKVPIVKFTYKAIELEADISLYNTLALHNTELLRNYCKIDGRLQILGYALKLFAKNCDIGAASRGSLSSYAYVLMVIYYLQQRNPPVLPVLQEIYEGPTKPDVIVDNWNIYSFQDIDNLPNVWKDYNKNIESLGKLWIGLFEFYANEFDFKKHVVSIRQKERLTRLQKLWNSKCIAIEDPFDLTHNLGGGISRRMNCYILKAFIKGREIFGCPIPKPPELYNNLQEYLFDGRVLTDGVMPPHNRGCFICGKIGHKIKECPRKIAKKAKKNEKGRNGKNAGLWQEKGPFQNRSFERQQLPKPQHPQQISRDDHRNALPQEHFGQYNTKKPVPLNKFSNHPNIGMNKSLSNNIYLPLPPRPPDVRMNSTTTVGGYVYSGIVPMPISTPSARHGNQASFVPSIDQNEQKDQLDDPAIVRCISSKQLQQSGPPPAPFLINQSPISLPFNDLQPRFHTPHPFQYPHIYEPKRNTVLQSPAPIQPPRFNLYPNSNFVKESAKPLQQNSASSIPLESRPAPVFPPPGFSAKDPYKGPVTWPDKLNPVGITFSNANSHAKNGKQVSTNLPPSSQPLAIPGWFTSLVSNPQSSNLGH